MEKSQREGKGGRGGKSNQIKINEQVNGHNSRGSEYLNDSKTRTTKTTAKINKKRKLTIEK